MATHAIKGDDGETVYLSDAEYKQYKSRRKRLGCLAWTIFVIVCLVIGYLKSKEDENKGREEQAGSAPSTTAVESPTNVVGELPHANTNVQTSTTEGPTVE